MIPDSHGTGVKECFEQKVKTGGKKFDERTFARRFFPARFDFLICFRAH